MAVAVEGTWRVELTCRKVRQYSCDSARLRCSTPFRFRRRGSPHTDFCGAGGETPPCSGEKRWLAVPGAGERRAELRHVRRESAGKRSADRPTGAKRPAEMGTPEHVRSQRRAGRGTPRGEMPRVAAPLG